MSLFDAVVNRDRVAPVNAGGLVINIRGSNGSGKSTAVVKLLKAYTVRSIKGLCGPSQPEAYELRIPGVKAPVFVLGTYERVTGGTDNIQPFDLVLDLLVKYMARGHVIFEGIVISGSYGRTLEMLEPHAKRVILAYMDTPVEICMMNVMKRRADREDYRELYLGHLLKSYKRCASIRNKIAWQGIFHRQEDISFANGMEKIVQWLRE